MTGLPRATLIVAGPGQSPGDIVITIAAGNASVQFVVGAAVAARGAARIINALAGSLDAGPRAPPQVLPGDD
jgi:hypothetical protein